MYEGTLKEILFEYNEGFDFVTKKLNYIFKLIQSSQILNNN